MGKMTEDQMGKYLLELGKEVTYLEDEADKDSWIIDSTLVIEEALGLGYSAKLDEETQEYIFERRK